jgi:hypothetical protein
MLPFHSNNHTNYKYKFFHSSVKKLPIVRRETSCGAMMNMLSLVRRKALEDKQIK